MIQDLDKALTRLLIQEVSDLDENNVRFEAPDENFAPSLPAVNLFLYDIRENLELRSNEWVVERGSHGKARKKWPPIRVECSYLLTAWAGDIESEHRLLGKVMMALVRHPTIPGEFLQGSLKDQPSSLPAIALQSGHLEGLGEFWQAIGGKPKAALHYSVTIGVEPFAPVEEPLVVEKIIAVKTGVES